MERADLLPQAEISEFCKRWQIAELALFGSVLRSDFGPESDLDVLVTFTPDADWGLLDHHRMKEVLATLLGREVDLLTKRAVEKSQNWLRRREILSTAQVVYRNKHAILPHPACLIL